VAGPRNTKARPLARAGLLYDRSFAHDEERGLAKPESDREKLIRVVRNIMATTGDPIDHMTDDEALEFFRKMCNIYDPDITPAEARRRSAEVNELVKPPTKH